MSAARVETDIAGSWAGADMVSSRRTVDMITDFLIDFL